MNDLEYDLLSFEVNKPSKILIKTSNAKEYIDSDIQNIKVPKIDDLIIEYVRDNIVTRFS